MDYERYLDLIGKEKFEEAVAFKSRSMPKRFFKYISLRENDDELNEKKFKTLEKHELHMDSFESYNDPFEGTFLLIDEKRLIEHGWQHGVVSEYYKFLTQGFKICSLSATTQQNMPMWAYYANNHKGFCLEYHFTEHQKKYIFPVAYDDVRQEATSLIANMIIDEMKVIQNNKDASVAERVDMTTKDTSIANLLIFLSIAAKHRSWEHEKEYRIIAPAKHDSFPAIATKIYAGLNCDECHIERLCKIARGHIKEGIPIEVYRMRFDSMSKEFRLKEERIPI